MRGASASVIDVDAGGWGSGVLNGLRDKLEELERLLLSRRRSTGSYGAYDVDRVGAELDDVASNLIRFADDFAWDANFLEGARPDLKDKIEALKGALEDLANFCRWASNDVVDGIVREMDFVAKPDGRNVTVSQWLLESYRSLREKLSKLGRDCGFELRRKKPGDEIDVALLANDVANCIHVVAEEAAKLRREILGDARRSGRCYISRGADPWLAELCRKWDSYVDRNEHLYISEDLASLVGIVMDGHASFRVGASKGHATHVYVEDDGVKVEYYDDDRPVNEIFKEVMGRFCDCRLRKDGVTCWCPKTREVGDALARMLSLVTSMDIRMNEHGFEWELERAKKFVWGEAVE